MADTHEVGVRGQGRRLVAASQRITSSTTGPLWCLAAVVGVDLVAMASGVPAGWAPLPAAVPLLPLAVGEVTSRIGGGR